MHHIKKLKSRVPLLVVILMSVFLTVLLVMTIRRTAKQTSYMSAVSWLNSEIVTLLNECYDKNSIYPNSLDELTIPFPGDNTDLDMLKLFTYVTDGNSFKLVLETNPEKKYRYEQIGIKGKMVKFNRYIGDKLTHSIDYNNLSIHEIKF